LTIDQQSESSAAQAAIESRAQIDALTLRSTSLAADLVNKTVVFVHFLLW
jgi:hypothetical protein